MKRRQQKESSRGSGAGFGRALRVVLKSLAYAICGAVGLIVAIFALLAVPRVRAFAVEQALAYANRNIENYRIAIASVDRLDPWGVQARGVQVFDAKDRQILHVPWLSVRIQPFALFQGTLALTRVEIDGARARLYPSIPASSDGSQPRAAEPSSFTVRVDRVRVRDAVLVTHWSGRRLRASVESLEGGGRYGHRPAVALERAALRVQAEGHELLRLHTTEGRWSAERGGNVAIEAVLAGAPLTVRAEIPALAGVDPWPIRHARLRLRDLTRRSLSLLGVEDGAQLTVPVDLALDAHVRGERLEIGAELRAGRARLWMEASAEPERYSLALQLASARLSEISGMLPELEVAGELRARASPGPELEQGEFTPRRASLRWRNVTIDGAMVPPGEVNMALRPHEIRITELELDGFERALALSGAYDWARARGRASLGFDGFELGRVEVFRRRGIVGSLDGALDVRFGSTFLRGHGDLELRRFAHASGAVEQLALAFDLRGRPDAPRGDLDLRARGITAGELRLDSVRVKAQATREAVAAELVLQGPNSELHAVLDGTRSETHKLLVHGAGRGTVANNPVRFELRALEYGERGISLAELSLRSGRQRVTLRGELGPRQELDAQLALRAVDLAPWAALAGVAARGTLDARAELCGTLARPRMATRVALRGVAYRSYPALDARLRARADMASRRAHLVLAVVSSRTASARPGQRPGPEVRAPLRARASVSLQLPRRPRDVVRAALRAEIAASVTAHLPVAPISALAGDALAGLEGELDITGQAQGTLEHPELDAVLRARLKRSGEQVEPQEALRLALSAGSEQVKGELRAWDARGQLLALSAFVDWPGGSPRAALERPASWVSTRFKLMAQLRERRLDALQGAFAQLAKLHVISLPVRAGGMLYVEGNRGELDGALQLQAVVFGDQLDRRCALGTQSALRFDAHFKKDRVSAQLMIKTDEEGTLRGTAGSRVVLHGADGPSFGPAWFALHASDVALHQLPGLCNLAGGRASLAVEASGIGDERPSLDARASIADLRAPDSEPVAVEARARLGVSSAELRMELEGARRRFGALTARLQLSHSGGAWPTIARSAPLRARLRLDRMPLANLLAFTDAVSNVRGTASAELSVSGKLNDPHPAGHVELEDVHMTIAALAQPVRGVNGRLELEGNRLTIPRITARERDGKLRIEGRGRLDDDLSGELVLDVSADEFPLRQQGKVIGELTTRARLDVDVSSGLRATGVLKILDGRIWLTGERGKDVQSLDPHPHVRFANARRERAGPQPDRTAAPAGFQLTTFRVYTERPLWLMHKDFSMQVGVELLLVQLEGGAKLTGQAVIQRGELQLLGKTFKVTQGSAVRFTGAVPPDPQLDIRAKYEPPTGRALFVEVSGPGSSPQLAFSGAANNVGEALAVLTGRSDPQTQTEAGDPTAAMASLASDLTAGLLIMTARRELGDWVPMITLETGRYGQPTRARAGFDASQLIPEWLEGIARGAYVEGFIGAAPAGRGGGTLGATVEIALPRDLVTTFGIGSNAAWSADIAWAP